MSVQLNTLFITSEGASLYKDHETVVVKVNGEKRMQVPMLHLGSVVCLGPAYVSPDLMAACSDGGIHVAFLSHSGRFLARVEGLPGGNVLLRRQQYRAADDGAQSLRISAAMVLGKLTNTRQFLLHARRDAAEERKEGLGAVCDRLAQFIRRLPEAKTVEEVRGIEGIAAKDYFGVFNSLIKRSEEAFRFEGRSRRPPLDRVNALLSFGYALLMQDCTSALCGVGLDPAVGYLHEDRPGRLALALDLMEELRVPLVDRLVLALINRSQVAADDLTCDPSGGRRLVDEARKRFLVAYQEAKQGAVRHEFLAQDTLWGQVAHLQSRLLARVLRGDLEVYPPFTIR